LIFDGIDGLEPKKQAAVLYQAPSALDAQQGSYRDTTIARAFTILVFSYPNDS
jgi:hypothetical protein